jgi:hypothetical protein
MQNPKESLDMRRWTPFAVALLVAAGACYEDDAALSPSGRPVARVLLTDAPFPYDSVASVNIYVSRIEASATFDTSGAGTWSLIVAPQRVFDLLSLQQGTTALLGEGEIPAGQYQAVRMIINSTQSSIRWHNGSNATVNWQNHTGTAEMPLYALVESPVGVDQVDGAEIVIDFDLGRSFLFDFFGGREFTFLPWIRAVNTAITGAIEGYVTSSYTGTSAPIENANVSVYYSSGDSLNPGLGFGALAATGRTNASGYYKVAFLRAGTYGVHVQQPEYPFLSPVVTDYIPVTAGQTATHSVSLPEAGSGSAYVQISGPATVGVGGTIGLQVAVGDQNGPVANPVVTWAISDTGVASLVDSGTVAFLTGKRGGTVAVSASSGGLSDTVDVEVIGSTAPVASIAVSPASRTLDASDSASSYGLFTAVLRDSAGIELLNRPITWSTSDSTIARIWFTSGSGAYVRGMTPGTVQVRAASQGKTGTASVTVVP